LPHIESAPSSTQHTQHTQHTQYTGIQSDTSAFVYFANQFGTFGFFYKFPVEHNQQLTFCGGHRRTPPLAAPAPPAPPAPSPISSSFAPLFMRGKWKMAFCVPSSESGGLAALFAIFPIFSISSQMEAGTARWSI